MEFTIIPYGTIFFQKGIPKDFVSYKIPGTEPFFTNGEFGSILGQYKNHHDYQYLYGTVKARKDFDLIIDSHNPSVGIHLQTENSLPICDGQGSRFLRQGQFDFAYFQHISAVCHFKKDNTYSLFGLYPTQALLQSAGRTRFIHFLDNALSCDNVSFLCRGMPSSVFLLDCIECLRSRPSDNSIIDKMLGILDFICGHPVSDVVDDASRIERIYEARNLIKANPGMHFSLKKLARIAGTNEKYLKRDFKKVFGTTPFLYYRYVRNYNIKKLLVTTDYSISEIAYHMGMEDTASFHHAFDSISRLTPMEWRRKAREEKSCCKDWIEGLD